MTDEHNKERRRDGAKSLVKAAWNKWRSRAAGNALQTAIRAVVATTVAGGLAVGAIGYAQAAEAKKELATLQNTVNGLPIPPPDASQSAGAAQQAADSAQAAADQAAITATEAQKAADAAQTAADNAQTRSASAQESADQAAASAASAKHSADDAQKAADDAQGSANHAAALATEAQGLANGAQSTANEARSLATGAQKAAQDAQTSADTANARAGEALTAASNAQASANEALAKTLELQARLPRYFSDPATENQNATLTAASGRLHNFGFVDFDGGKYLFSYTWLRAGFNTHCTGGIKLGSSAFDSLGKPYPIITAGTPIDDYTTQNFVTRSAYATPAAGSQNLFFVINSGGNCKYSDLSITITKVVSTTGSPGSTTTTTTVPPETTSTTGA